MSRLLARAGVAAAAFAACAALAGELKHDVGTNDNPLYEKECGGCHRFLGPSGPVGTGSMGPNLSGFFTPFYPPTASGDRAWDEKALRDWLRNPRASRPHSTMPPVALDEDDLRRVAAELGGARPDGRSEGAN